MTAVGFETLAVLLVLLPGFVAAGITRTLCVRTRQTEFDKLIEALVYSFLAYSAFVAIFHRFPLQAPEKGSENMAGYLSALHPTDVLFLLGLGTVIGILVGVSIANDLHGRVFRTLRLTNRTSRPSIWLDVFSEVKDYVQVEFQDGRSLIGWPRYFSDTPEESSLFLENAAWISADGTTVEIPGSGILVTKEMTIEAIMFLREAPRSKQPSTEKV
jgi:hypothetical protein